jgi:1-acyl-sn-glycerol-3-phosphate acyltransferase
MEAKRSWLGGLARRLARGLARLYYSRIELSGAARIPAEGPVLFVANHANSLLDPVVIGIAAGRPVHFLAKAPLFRIPVFGRVLFALGMVPAFRASDDASQVGRNVESLSKAAKFLAQGEAVGIFPEGKSHDALQLEQVKSGAARMALQAMEAEAGELLIVPLGINYEKKERFRSAVWVRVGKPIRLREWIDANPGEPRQQVRGLTHEIDQRLRHAVIHLEDAALEPMLELLEGFLPAGRFTPISRLRQRKRITEAMNHIWTADRARAEALMSRLQEFKTRVKAERVTPTADVLRLRGWKLGWRLSWEALFMDLGFFLVLIGTLHHLIPFFVVRGLARLMQAPGRSTIALARLAIGLPIYLAWYVLIWRWIAGYFLPWVAWVWLIPMPIAGLLALKYWWRVRDTSGVWWREIWLLLFKRKALGVLREEHAMVGRDLNALATEYGRLRGLAEEKPVSWRQRAVQTARAVAIGAAMLVAGAWSAWLLKPSSIPELLRAAPEIGVLAPATLDSWLTADEKLLEQNIAGLIELEARAARIQTEFNSGARSFYSQKDDDEIRQLLFKYLTHRAALMNLIWKYQKHAKVRDERNAARAFLACFVSACALHDASVKLVTYFENAPNAVRKLNEAEPLWNIPPGVYDMVKANLMERQTREFMAAWMEQYEASREVFDRQGLMAGPYERFHAAVDRHRQSGGAVASIVLKAGISDPLTEASVAGKGLAYKGQAFISTWLGSTRVRIPREGAPMISAKQLEKVREQLRPGDILLERQNWYLSRAFMPGFWAHAALYVGTTNDLTRLGLLDDPRVRKHWQEFAERDRSGCEHVILEAVPQGVRITTLEHCLGVADAAAVLRPKVSEEQRREAIARAFSHLGKAYDFDFDFFSSDKLVCTELVCRAYDGNVQFPLVNVMGRKTLPPTEMARKFVTELKSGRGQLECVCFLDGDEKTGKASFRDPEVFATTIDRPGLSWFQR